MPDITTVSAVLRAATAQLESTSPTARLDAELLMAAALGATRSDLLLRHMADPAPADFAQLIARRIAQEPIAYILGTASFHGIDLLVTPDVLIPRGDSETLMEAARLAFSTRPPGRILDCGTGSGALLIAALALFPQAQGVGIDRSPAALAVAKGNAESTGVLARSQWLVRDWDAAAWANDLGTFDLILANPPYVEDAAAIEPTVRDHEPHGALFAGPEGLDAYRMLVPQLPGLLTPDGIAIVEIGSAQADAVTAIAAESQFSARLHRDLAGRPRAVELSGGP